MGNINCHNHRGFLRWWESVSWAGPPRGFCLFSFDLWSIFAFSCFYSYADCIFETFCCSFQKSAAAAVITWVVFWQCRNPSSLLIFWSCWCRWSKTSSFCTYVSTLQFQGFLSAVCTKNSYLTVCTYTHTHTEHTYKIPHCISVRTCICPMLHTTCLFPQRLHSNPCTTRLGNKSLLYRLSSLSLSLSSMKGEGTF